MDTKVLDQAVEQGVITPDQRNAIIAIAEGRQPVNRYGEDERFRLISGFNDVFLSLGIGLFAAGIAGVASLLDNQELLILGIGAIVMWGLSELFAARLRITLPSIVSACGFVGFIAGALMVFLNDDSCSRLFGLSGTCFGYIDHLNDNPDAKFNWSLLLFSIPLVASLVYYLRFRLPFALFLVAGFAFLAIYPPALYLAVKTGLIDTGSMGIFDSAASFTRWFAVALGLIVFSAAMAFDLSDRERMTRRSDAAFWLHLAASPMLVHAIMSRVAEGASVLAIVIGFGAMILVAMLIDRRAILVAALAYVGTAFAVIFDRLGLMDEGEQFSFTLVALGALVLLLGIGWRPLRKRLIGVLPDRVQNILPVIH